MSIQNPDLIAEVLSQNADKLATAIGPSAGAEGCDNRERLLQALSESAQSVFSKMCGVDLRAEEPYSGRRSNSDGFVVSGIIGLSGLIRATIVVGLHQELLFHVASEMTDGVKDEIDDEMIDLVGELANMVGGNAKERMAINALILSLPTVVAGEGHRVAFGSTTNIACIPFESPNGKMTVELGVARQ